MRISMLSAIISLILIFVFIPGIAYGFINFCFPISSVILIFALSWPYWVIASLIPPFEQAMVSVHNESAAFVVIFIMGFIIDIFLLWLVGRYIDKKKGKKVASNFSRWSWRLPLVLIILLALLMALLYFRVDQTCW